MTQPREEIRTALDGVQRFIERYQRGCPAVELEILRLACARLSMGLDQYGPMEREDGRDWREEARLEAIDGFIYSLRAGVE